VTTLIGPHQIGRTWLALQIALSYATDQAQALIVAPVQGEHPDDALTWTKHGIVAYYAAQDPTAALTGRVDYLAGVLKIVPPPPAKMRISSTTPPDEDLPVTFDDLVVLDGHAEPVVHDVAEAYAGPILWLPTQGSSHQLRPEATWHLQGTQQSGWSLACSTPYVLYGSSPGWKLTGTGVDRGRSWWDIALPPFWRLL